MTSGYQNIFHASLWVALSAILYGFLGYLGTSAMQENLPIDAMLFWRFLIAGCWMSIFVFKNQLSQKSIAVDKRILLFVFFLGALGYAGASGFYFVASRYIGTGLAMVIFFSYPILVALFSWLLHRKKLQLGTIMTLVIMTLGLILLRQVSDASFSLIGILCALAAALCYAFYVVSSKQFSSVSVDSTQLAMTVSFGSAFIFLILALTTQHFAFPHSAKTWGYLLSFGILATAVPIQLVLEGLKHISSMRASIISVLEPVVTLLLGISLLHESVSNTQLIGGLLIIGSALLIQFQKEL